MALQKTTLAVAISMALTSGLMMSAETKAMQGEESSLNTMMEESTIDLELRNLYFNRDYREKRTSPSPANLLRQPSIQESWAQGARLNLQSGYFMDMFGFDASWYGSFKLHGDRDEWGSGALHSSNTPKHPTGHDERDQRSYDKLGQIFMKAHFGDESLNGNIKAGRMFLDTAVLNDSDSRVTPSTTEAIYADVNWNEFTFYGFSSEKASAKTDSGFHKYEGKSYTYSGTTSTPGKIGDWTVNSIGTRYDASEGYGFNAQLAQAKDYMKADYLNAYYTLTLNEDANVLLDGHYHKIKGDGKYQEKVKHHGMMKDRDSEIFNFAAQLQLSDLKFALSYQKVNGDKYNDSWGGSDDNGIMTWNSVRYSDFYRKDEKSWMAKVDYDFSSMGLPGLSFMTLYVHGRYSEGNKTHSEWERNTDLTYSFQEGALAGLSIKLRNATFRTHHSDNDSLDDNRLIVDYTVALL
ncbi:MAG: OprD family outer membrane porin [Endozoicomonadaceae bacterium]|nr:OprD family outer membrane porin [Endozoicomonadaceae bacterium]